MLKIESLSLEISKASLLKGVSTVVEPGQVMAIIGANGAGKSSLLKVLAGDLTPSSGSIAFSEYDLLQWPLVDKARHVGVLPQFSLLNFPYTVEDVISLGRAPHATGRSVDQKITAEAMELMDIGYLKKRLYTQLSGGEKQRTQLARVMTQIWRAEDSPAGRLLLLDEPTTALDLGHQQQLMEVISAFARQNVAVLMVVHDVNLASRYANSVLALSCGRCVAQGPVAEVIRANVLTSVFNADIRMIEDPVTGRQIIAS